ncbi:MAG: hypothetical protein R3F62_30510 [Planctomycetota bacterium]
MSAGHHHGPIELGPRDVETVLPTIKRYAMILLVLGFLLAIPGLIVVRGNEIGSTLYRSILVCGAFYVSISLGALFFVIVQHMVKAGWSVVVRRVAEGLSMNVTWVWLILLPLVAAIGMGASDIYPAMADDHAAHGAAHEDGHGDAGHGDAAHDEGHGAPAHEAGAALPAVAAEHGEHHMEPAKKWYLSFGAFVIKLLVCFGVWILLAAGYFRSSVKQDSTKDVAHTKSMEWWAPPSMILFAVTLCLFGFDALMALDPHWYSTIFGIYYFAGCLVSFFASAIVFIFICQQGGLIKEVSREHYQDLGKFMFAFVVFWAYIGFSQFMLIWYGNLPEETVWFLRRFGGLDATGDLNWGSSWMLLSIWLAVGHFGVPFLLLMSRFPKRHPNLLVLGALWMLGVHYVDMFWLVKPTTADPGMQPMPIPVLDAAMFLAVGGVFLFATANFLKGKSLIPEGDPRLGESLAFENF